MAFLMLGEGRFFAWSADGSTVFHTKPVSGPPTGPGLLSDPLFAMLVADRLVVKLPRQRVDALIAAGKGERFDPGHGRIMKEWLVVNPTSPEEWLPLTKEAMAFVASIR